MRGQDLLKFNWRLLQRHRLRSALQVAAVAIGICAVILLTGLGEGARRFVVQEFESLGNRMLIVLPGKKETTGGSPPMLGTSPRDLTLDDALAFYRIPGVAHVAPVIAGAIEVSQGRRARDAITIGTTQAFFTVRSLTLQQGRALPLSASERASPVCVLGAGLKRELFGDGPALGRWIRAGDYRFRVSGVLAGRGESVGLDLDDVLLIPVRSAEMLFNSPGLFRVLVELKQAELAEGVTAAMQAVISQRHEGDDDITVISQDALLSSFNSLLTSLTVVVATIAGISLVVAGVLIMNVSLISVSQRRAEIGLLKALGASEPEVLKLFLSEAVLLALLGVAFGGLISYLLLQLGGVLMPLLPLAMPWWALLVSAVSAVLLALLFAWYPARQAARLDPVLALQGER